MDRNIRKELERIDREVALLMRLRLPWKAMGVIRYVGGPDLEIVHVPRLVTRILGCQPYAFSGLSAEMTSGNPPSADQFYEHLGLWAAGVSGEGESAMRARFRVADNSPLSPIVLLEYWIGLIAHTMNYEEWKAGITMAPFVILTAGQYRNESILVAGGKLAFGVLAPTIYHPQLAETLAQTSIACVSVAGITPGRSKGLIEDLFKILAGFCLLHMEEVSVRRQVIADDLLARARKIDRRVKLDMGLWVQHVLNKWK